ncbi:MAG: chromosomal replication initiator protein DnaA [Chitinivibrionales bacterium]|nr:chromosomal replication initiator protein DnaA [Chitinivibrionales bacterium]MBD3395440.1 chromosomal replication initiator protein DnaA [Chitinivibrionales bacterium]
MLISPLSSHDSDTSLWSQCLEIIEQIVGPSSFETWFRTTHLAFTSQKTPCIEVPNQFFADFIEEHFAELVSKVLKENGINPAGLAFIPSQRNWKALEPITESLAESRDRIVPRKIEKQSQFHPNYRFETFVVGDSNRMAHAASLAVAEAPGKTSFNPLTIYGGTGLGKTHLLQAIGHYALTETTVENVLYMTCQEFTNEYINYVTHKGDSTSFYRKFASVELLLIDDIHFLSGKPGTQKEFYRIFNNLMLQNKQIVLSSDRAPETIPDMMDHIINRFMGGLTTDIQPPNFETRMAIISKKAEIDGIALPDEVAHFIAGYITSNVRELEGTLIKLIASASFTGKDITMDVAREVFGDVLSRRDRRLTNEFIQKEVASYFGISANQLSAHTRKRDVTVPRSIAMYLCKKWTKQSLRTIGLDFGGRDYSTVIHACKKIEAEIETDRQLRQDIAQLEKTIEPLV